MTALEPDQTAVLLARWHRGDRDALDQLLERDLPWLHEHVSARLGDLLRQRGDTVDFVGDAVVQVLTFAPRFTVGSKHQFRGLLARIVENVLRDRADFFRAKRRDLGRERPLSETVLRLGAGSADPRPSEVAARHEEEAWLHLALELLEPVDRQAIVLRQWDGLGFAEIGARLGQSEDAARMRFHRALPRLSELVERLRRGGLP